MGDFLASSCIRWAFCLQSLTTNTSITVKNYKHNHKSELQTINVTILTFCFSTRTKFGALLVVLPAVSLGMLPAVLLAARCVARCVARWVARCVARCVARYVAKCVAKYIARCVARCVATGLMLDGLLGVLLGA